MASIGAGVNQFLAFGDKYIFFNGWLIDHLPGHSAQVTDHEHTLFPNGSVDSILQFWPVFAGSHVFTFSACPVTFHPS